MMRTSEQILSDMDAQTECRKAGRRHKFQRDGEPATLFYDGKVSGVFREQLMVCVRCGHTISRPALETVKAEQRQEAEGNGK